ncbi:uncharacterized protein LOC126687340 [Mercurialis annua]|uniref:uncharacterized protein LOC126687340 n=1 Tax=Mercurialis annua TaxID=3986 RepID=UPI0021600EE7|nr:uncharacterized protein LOC126687340 [Mercurialis annua]
MRQYQVDMTLVTALVERWRPETHTFMFPEGECTITLQDVAILTGLPIDGAPITGPTVSDWNSITIPLLGRRYKPSRTDNVGQVKVSWLKTEFQNFENVLAPGGQEQVDWAVRAYLLIVIWSLCFPDLSSGKIGLRILPLLEDLTRVRTYSWGSATLAHLYHEMCLSTLISEQRKNIGGAIWLLQLWAFERLRPLRPRLRGGLIQQHLPLGDRWAGHLNFQDVPRQNLAAMRLALDEMRYSDIDWQPYSDLIISQLPSYCFEGSHFWRARVPLIYFHIIEWHQPDRVLQQFGLVQPIPEAPLQQPIMHGVQYRGSSDFQALFSEYIDIWDCRERYVVHGRVLEHPPHFHSEYMDWYRLVSRRWITHRGAELGSHRDTMERIRLQSEADSTVRTYARTSQLATREDRRNVSGPPPDPAVPPDVIPEIDPPTVDVQRIRGRRRGRPRQPEPTREIPTDPFPPPVVFHGDTEDFIRRYYGSSREYGSTSSQPQGPQASSFSVPPVSMPYVDPSFGQTAGTTPLATQQDPLDTRVDYQGNTEEFIRRYTGYTQHHGSTSSQPQRPPSSSFSLPPSSVPYVDPWFGETAYITPLATPDPLATPVDYQGNTEDFIRRYTEYTQHYGSTSSQPEAPPSLSYSVPQDFSTYGGSAFTPFQPPPPTQTPPAQQYEGLFEENLSYPQTPAVGSFSQLLQGYIPQPPSSSPRPTQSPSQMHFSLTDEWVSNLQAPTPPLGDVANMTPPSFSLGLGNPSSQAPDDEDDDVVSPSGSDDNSSGPDLRPYRPLTHTQMSRRQNRGRNLRTLLRTPDRTNM